MKNVTKKSGNPRKKLQPYQKGMRTAMAYWQNWCLIRIRKTMICKKEKEP